MFYPSIVTEVKSIEDTETTRSGEELPFNDAVELDREGGNDNDVPPTGISDNRYDKLRATKDRYLEIRTRDDASELADLEVLSSWYREPSIRWYDCFTTINDIANIAGADKLLKELPSIDFSTLPILIPHGLANKYFRTRYQNCTKWYKSRNILRINKAKDLEIQLCSKIDKSWEKLLVACGLVSRLHPKVDKMSVFNINYGKPTELGVEIIISACEMITGGEGALRSWILANFDFDNPNQNIDALCETLSEIYDIPLKIMEGFVVAICCQEWESRGKEWIIPRLAKYINLTGRKYTGLYVSKIKL